MGGLVNILFPEILIACASFGFFISSLVSSGSRKGNNNDILPPLLLSVVWFSSAVAGIIRYYTDAAIERRCSWRRTSSNRATAAVNFSRTTLLTRRSTTDSLAINHPHKSSTSIIGGDGGDGGGVCEDTTYSEGTHPHEQEAGTTTNGSSGGTNPTKGAIHFAVAGLCPWVEDKYLSSPHNPQDRLNTTSNHSNSNNSNKTENHHHTIPITITNNITGFTMTNSFPQLYDNSDNNHGASRIKTRQWTDVVKSFLRLPRTSLLLLHGPAVVLLFTLIFRLFAVRNFRSRPALLDFGPLNGIVNEDGSYLSSRSFVTTEGGEDDMNYVLHALMGFGAAFLSFPAVSGTIARTFSRCCLRATTNGDRHEFVRTLVALLHLICASLAIYPTYALLTRITAADRYPQFATSTYANDSLEWIVGYVIGVAGGMLVTSIVGRLLAIDLPGSAEGGLGGYMKTFEVSVRQRMTRQEEKNEMRDRQQGAGAGVPPPVEMVEEFRDNEQLDGVAEEGSAVTSPALAVGNKSSGGNGDVAVVKREVKYAFGKLEEYTSTRSETESCCWSCNTFLYNIYHTDILTITNVLSTISLSVFTLSTLVAGFYMGITWNSCAEGDGNNCVNSNVNGINLEHSLSYLFMFFFGAVEGVYFWFSRRQYGPHFLRCRC